MQRRDHWSILGLLLGLLSENGVGGSAAPLSRIAQTANLPYDRFTSYLAELRQGSLITDEEMPRLTDKGQALLRSWRQWEAVLQRFGLD